LDLGSGVVVLDENRHDPAADIVEVYDNSHPAPRFKRVLAIEALASWTWIILAVVGLRDCREDCLQVVEQPRASPFGEVQVRACIEDDSPTIWGGSCLRCAVETSTGCPEP
jgi:hypothetical protein